SQKSSRQQRGIREIDECLSCFYQESLIAHTLFEHTRLPLKTWFIAIQLLTQAKTCISALELHRHLNINIKTAQLLKHKIMQTLTESEEKRVLQGRIECSDAYLGGIIKEGKTSKNKIPFITAIQTDLAHHPRLAVLTPLNKLTREQLKNWGMKHVNQQACILSNSEDHYKGLDGICEHRSYDSRTLSSSIIDKEFKWTKTISANVKTAFSGAIHAFDFRKYGRRYLGNMQFRFNHRFDLKKCFYEVLNCLITTSPKPSKILFSELSG
ncbi:MAG: IS1595 family transposase, partial [Lentisphaeraceae bacterium]|nr:IS1595 family transposase [Lentisphaeraceae bacterium]